ncbi:hypothetical protein FG386_000435 [Cryptosporidium ryanae]|uniref:uncharacterized protein n=1 Tax=Cryptosporidium ryanae TaxID=515981 RepID=UPI00351A83FD|nr:hypothetical protein FG386_000435 [Cryptosporidium ryanae]
MKVKNNDIDLEQTQSYVDNSLKKDKPHEYFIIPSDTPRLSEEMLALREKLSDELNEIEKRIYELETLYWEQTTDVGNMLRGWDGYSTSSSILFTPGGRKPSINVSRNSFRPGSSVFSERERWFSLSSVTSPIDEEALVNLSNTGIVGETSSVAGSNVGSVVSNNSDLQNIGSEADNSTVISRKLRR